MRKSEIARKTGETEITLQLNLDGTGQYQIQTGVGFLDHMLTGFARHGSFDLAVQCQGDTWVDDHHTVEDVGICLGQAFAQALGDLRGVEEGDCVYFVHSFYAAECDDVVIATAEYGAQLTAAVARGNVMGCQFHPEKSGTVGLMILKTFCEGEW